MSSKERILKDSFYNSISTILLRISQIIQGIIVANILGPSLFGLKSAIQMVSDYGPQLHLGSINIFYIERQKLEFKSGKQAKQKENITNLVFSHLIIISFLFLFVCLLLFFFLPFSNIVNWSLLIIGVLVPITLLYSFFNMVQISQEKFKQIFRTNLIQTFFVTPFVILGVLFFGVIGYFLGATIGFLVVILYQYSNLKLTLRFTFYLRGICLLIKKGLPLFLFGLAFLLFSSIDKLFILFGFGKTELGLYTIGLFFANLFFFLLINIILPIVPKIYQNFTNSKNLIILIMNSNNFLYRFIYYILFVILFLSPFVIFILPKYVGGIVYINILIFSAVFFPNLIVNYFFAKNKTWLLIKWTFFFMCIGLLLNTFVLLYNLSSIYIAFATMISFFLYGATINFIGYKEILGSYRLAFREVFNYLWPLGYALVGYGLLWLLAHFWLYFILNYYVVKVIQAILFTIWYFPILWKIEKEHAILKIIWQGVKNKFKKEPITIEQNL